MSRVAYLSICCQLCQEFIHIFQSIALLKSLKHTVNLVCVIRGTWAQCQLCHLSRSEHWQRVGLREGINMKLKSSNCKTVGETCQFERRILQLQSPLTLEKLGLRACKSCRVANSEKLPKFSSSHSLLPLINETQPGSAKKTETKTVTGYYHHVIKPLPNWAWVPAFTWWVISWKEWFDEMSEDCLLSLSVHGWPLAAECLDAKMWEKPFNILTTGKLQVPPQSCSQWSKVSHIRLHSLVRMAAEVLGGKAEEEVGGWRGQKRTNLCPEPVADKAITLQLCLAEVGNSHLSKGLKSIWQGWAAVVGGLKLDKSFWFGAEFTQGNTNFAKLRDWIYHGGQCRKSLV